MNERKKRPSRQALVGMVLAALTMVSGLPGGGSTAAAGQAATPVATKGIVPELEYVYAKVEGVNRHHMTASAACTRGWKVVGGGGEALSNPHPHFYRRERFKLTELRPSAYVNIEGAHGYVASAAVQEPAFTGRWMMVAYAVCARPSSVSGWDLNIGYTSMSPGSMKRLSVSCDDPGQKVIGTGGSVVLPYDDQGQVGLQVARVDADGNQTRVQGHADAYGSPYSGSWAVRAFAICADAPAGYEVVTAASDESGSEQLKLATKFCEEGKQGMSAGAAITDDAPGHVSLVAVDPRYRRLIHAEAVENTPYNGSWDFIVVRGICVDGAP